ncbi:MAG: divalent-cation tolerance protein CutA [Candidatus Micrarchaeia archaeon]
MLLVYTTLPKRRDAEKIAQQLLKEKMVACANIFEITSLYVWEKKLKREPEFVLLCKTSRNKKALVENRLKQLHPYQLPAIIFIPVTASREFSKWVEDSCRQ